MRVFFCFIFFFCLIIFAEAQPRVLGLYTGRHDAAHISFVKETNAWLAKLSTTENFSYTASDNWRLLNADTLATYQLVIFLDTRPDDAAQRTAFENYMRKGGAWLGFHFAAFALSPSSYPQNWDWYHQTFLGSGQYVSNTWRPTPAMLIREASHTITEGMPATWKTSPNEWYRWENDLRLNPDITIIYAIDSSSFPLGTGPKKHEIWHNGYYPVVWANRNYHMIYCNMGHNDIDYEGGTNKELSASFANADQRRLVTNSIRWLLSQSGRLPATIGD